MATKQIYVRDEDEKVFDRAKELSGGEPYSKLVIDALKEYIANRETDQEEIIIKIGNETMKFLGKRI